MPLDLSEPDRELIAEAISQQLQRHIAAFLSQPNDIASLTATLEDDAADGAIRLFGAYLRRQKGDVTPLVNTLPTNASGEDESMTNIILNALPCPDASTPWEQIVEFRREEGVRRELLRLRRWMRRVNTELVSATACADELQDLLERYESYMRLNNMKTVHGRLEILATTTAQALENIAHFRFSAAVTSLFQIRHQKVQLIEGELAAPGRDVAFIARARAQFGPERLTLV